MERRSRAPWHESLVSPFGLNVVFHGLLFDMIHWCLLVYILIWLPYVENLRFTLCTDVSTKSHGDGTSCQLRQSTQNYHFCVSECRKTCAQRKGHCQPVWEAEDGIWHDAWVDSRAGAADVAGGCCCWFVRAVAPSEGVIGAAALGLEILIWVPMDGIIVVTVGEEALAWSWIVISICLRGYVFSFLYLPECILSVSFVGKSFCLMKRNAMVLIRSCYHDMLLDISEVRCIAEVSPLNYKLARGIKWAEEDKAG